MKRRKNKLNRLAKLPIVVSLVALLTWWFSSTKLLDVQLDSGRVKVYYILSFDYFPMLYLAGIGSLWCEIESDHGKYEGWLARSIDLIEDVELSHEIIDGNTIKIIDRGADPRQWIISIQNDNFHVTRNKIIDK